MSSLTIGPSIATANNMSPCEGPKCVPITFALTDSSRVDVSLLPLIQGNQISVIQAMFVNNVLNPERLIITCGNTGQKIYVPANSQGFVSVLLPSPYSFGVNLDAVPVGTVAVEIFALNFSVVTAFWAAPL